ncbi:MAG TPA: N-acetylmuramoyl-L-alanine amidase [Candidatus Limnocylindria bacterium]
MRALAMLVVIVCGLVVTAPVAQAAPPPWYPPLEWVPASPANYEVGRGGTKIQYIVIHSTDGTYAGTLSWFRDPNSHLSAHYVIRASDGHVAQAVSEGDTAFQARGFNQPAIGIEHEFDPASGIAYTDAEYRASATLVCAITRRYAIPADRQHIIGHNEVPNTDHSDPGPTWNWTYYMSLVRGCSTSAPAAGISFGDTGESVYQLQRDLVALGFLASADLAGGEGIFGPHTLAALQSFQSANGVPATGYYGALSQAALSRALVSGAPAASSSVPQVDLFPGDESDAVAQLQSALQQRGYMDRVTGYFGPMTQDAVRRFQADHGIIATGNYGPLTRAALARDVG